METSAIISLIIGLLLFGGGFAWSVAVATRKKGWRD